MAQSKINLLKNPYFSKPNISETDNVETVISKAEVGHLYIWNKFGASTYSPEQLNRQWSYMLWHGSSSNAMYTFFIASSDEAVYFYHKTSGTWSKIQDQKVHEQKAVSVTATLQANSTNCQISANNIPSGYTFLCWVGSATNGFIGTPYIERPDYSTTRVWTATTSGANQTITAVYICYR